MPQSDFQIDASEICTPDLILSFKNFISNLNYSLFLCSQKERDAIIDSWIKVMIVKDHISDFALNNDENFSDALSLSSGKSEDIHYIKLQSTAFRDQVDTAIKKWSNQQWGHRLESIYLENKESLDRVTFEMLRVSNQNLAAELYYRLMAKEQSFQQLSWDYGEGPEKNHAGKFQNQCLKDLPAGISPLLRRMKPNEPAKPRKFGKFFVILNLVQIKSAQYDENMKDYLLKNQLNGLFAEIRQSLLPDNIE